VTPAPAGDQGAWPPYRKIAPWATAWEGLLPVLRMHTLLERSYSRRTTMKRTNFPNFPNLTNRTPRHRVPLTTLFAPPPLLARLWRRRWMTPCDLKQCIKSLQQLTSDQRILTKSSIASTNKFPLPWKYPDPQLIHGSLEPPESTSPTASRLV